LNLGATAFRLTYCGFSGAKRLCQHWPRPAA